MSFVSDAISGVGDFFFGSEPDVSGYAQSPGQSWLQSALRPLLNQGIQAGLSGNMMFPVTQAPGAPGVPNYNLSPYSVAQAPYSSPTDYLQSGELRTAQNLLENFFAGGGGGSAGGGLSGQANTIYGNVLGDLATGLVGRYNQMQLPYNKMQTQANRDLWGQQYQYNVGLPLQQANLGYTAGQIPTWQAQQTAYQSPWNLTGLFSGTYGSPIVDPGSEGLFSSVAPYAALGGINKIFDLGMFRS